VLGRRSRRSEEEASANRCQLGGYAVCRIALAEGSWNTRPFSIKAVFGNLMPLEEINRLIESIPGVGLRLNLAGGVQILDE